MLNLRGGAANGGAAGGVRLDRDRLNPDVGQREGLCNLLRLFGIKEGETAVLRHVDQMLMEKKDRVDILKAIRQRLSSLGVKDSHQAAALAGTAYCIASGATTSGANIVHETAGVTTKEVVAKETSPADDGVGPHVVCFHGTAMNEAILRAQLARLLSSLQGKAKVTIIEGGRIMTNQYHPRVWEQRKFYASNVVLREYASNTVQDTYERLPQGVAYIEKKLGELSRPADILLGFSQGAMMLHAVAHRAANGLSAVPAPKGLILLCPPTAQYIVKSHSLNHPVDVPCLIVQGANDTVVGTAPEESAALYARPARWTHSGGHAPFPEDADEALRLVDALSRFILDPTSAPTSATDPVAAV